MSAAKNSLSKPGPPLKNSGISGASTSSGTTKPLSKPTGKGTGASKLQAAWPQALTFHVKVFKISAVDSSAAEKTSPATAAKPERTETPQQLRNAIPVTTVDMKGSDAASFKTGTKLTAIREQLCGTIADPFKFCSEDGATVEDERTLDEYFSNLAKPPKVNEIDFWVFVIGVDGVKTPLSTILSNPPFLLKLARASGGSLQTDSSLHSSTFKGKSPGPLKMSEIRKLIKTMSENTQKDEFCLADGTPISDDLTLDEYIGMHGGGIDETEKTPSILIRFQRAGTATKFHEASEAIGSAMQDLKPDLSFSDRSGQELQRDSSALQIREELNASQFAAKDANPAKFTSQMDENDWDHVVKNCGLLYGWKVDASNNQVLRATKPAFKLRTGLNMPTTPKTVYRKSNVKSQLLPEHLESLDDTPGGSDNETAVSSTNGNHQVDLPTVIQDLEVPLPSKARAIPSYVVNDRSRVEVVSVTHEFQQSMAQNHFSTTSVEASVSGGYAGWSAGASGGVESEQSQATTASQKGYSKTMIASYKFPRVTVNLSPDDLEPTEELEDAISLIRKTKNMNNLRKLHATFGHLFCQQIVLGGCLQTTKIVTGTEQSKQAVEKEKFKASVGVAVQSPVGVGGSVKASHEIGSSTDNGSINNESSESMVFEATGGNTILAADPASWCGSVADFHNWRVIEQSELSPLADAIAQVPGFAQLKQWFLLAIPKLAEYLVIPESRTLDFRFKLLEEEAVSRILGNNKPAYLGHDPDNAPVPFRTALRRTEKTFSSKGGPRIIKGQVVMDMTTITEQVTVTNKTAMFLPSSTQAPVIFQPTGEVVGTKDDKTRRHTVWRLEIPKGYNLGHNSAVIIKSLSGLLPTCHMTAYRNQQGVFLPAISSSEEPSYWRIVKLSGGVDGDPIKDGDQIRLCWKFSDQTSGFRDFFQDAYGRRRYTCPAEVESDTLYLKVPYPSFENLGSDKGVSLVLSTAPTSDPIAQRIRVTPQKALGEVDEAVINYNLHDLHFRLDSVGNNGEGDALDYMNHVVKSELEEYQKTRKETTEMIPGGPEDVMAGVLLGSAAIMMNPIAAIARFFF